MTCQERALAPNIITGKILLYDIKAYILIDPGSTYSFIVSTIASRLHREPWILDTDIVVHIPLEEFLVAQTAYRDYVVQINTVEFRADLIVLTLLEFDVILGMDWLFRHRAMVNCYTKGVIINFLGQAKVVFYGERQAIPSCLVSASTTFI